MLSFVLLPISLVKLAIAVFRVFWTILRLSHYLLFKRDHLRRLNHK